MDGGGDQSRTQQDRGRRCLAPGSTPGRRRPAPHPGRSDRPATAGRRRPAGTCRARAELFEPGALALRSHVLLRSRYSRGSAGGGSPSGGGSVRRFSGRDWTHSRTGSRRWAAAMRIFEVDQPGSQSVKRDRVARAGIEVPSNVTLRGCRLRVRGPDDRSRSLRCGPDPAGLHFLAGRVDVSHRRGRRWRCSGRSPRFPRATEMVFTFARPRPPGPSLADRAAAVGEPWLSYFEPDELRDALTDAGFSAVGFLGAEDAARYFAGRTDALVAPRRVSIAWAQV